MLETRTSEQSKFKPVTAIPIAIAGIGGLFLLKKILFHENGNGFKSHGHDALDHLHEHVHVTHNLHEPAVEGGWQHLTAAHSHRHNHLALEHSHRPHRNFESEHRKEAHIHDHEHPAG